MTQTEQLTDAQLSVLALKALGVSCAGYAPLEGETRWFLHSGNRHYSDYYASEELAWANCSLVTEGEWWEKFLLILDRPFTEIERDGFTDYVYDFKRAVAIAFVKMSEIKEGDK